MFMMMMMMTIPTLGRLIIEVLLLALVFQQKMYVEFLNAKLVRYYNSNGFICIAARTLYYTISATQGGACNKTQTII